MRKTLVVFFVVAGLASALLAGKAVSKPAPKRSLQTGPLTQLVAQSLLIKKRGGYSVPDHKVVDYTWIIINTMRRFPKDYKNIKDMRIPISLAWSESSFDHTAKSPAGCIGLFQVSPRTARYICRKYKIPYHRDTIRKELTTSVWFNVRVGLAILDDELRNTGGDVQRAILHYKCGSGNVANGGFYNPRYQELYQNWKRIHEKMS